MLTVVYCTKETKPEHKEHLIKSSGLHKHIEVIEIINNGESLTISYNRGLKQAKNDVVVFCHDDITIETKQWGKKLLKHYDKNEDYSILGVAGTKHIGESGRWWDDKKAMYGRVKHTHEGKTWMSKYSPDLGTNVEEVVLVDGVFFSVKQSRLKETFDETVEGYHFYDVDFCFRNTLAGTKTGVNSNIVINHQSIGITNDPWEANRVLFSEKFKDNLPLRINEEFKNRKMNVLLGCLNFKNLTGSEISTFELAKGVMERGYDVSIFSQLGGVLTPMARKLGIKLYDINNPPFFKIGDGQWGFMNPDGTKMVSESGKLYPIGQHNFDIIQTNHKPITERLLQLYPDANFVTIVRSLILELEDPIIDTRIKKYITIAPNVTEYLVNKFNINSDDINMIYNITSVHKMNDSNTTLPVTDKKVIIFPGTLNYLREQPIRELIKSKKDSDYEVWLIGDDNDIGYGKKLAEEIDYVRYFPVQSNLKPFYERADMVSGLNIGRSILEGFQFGVPAIGYDVNIKGELIGGEVDLPLPDNMDIYSKEYILDKYITTYKTVYNG